MTWKNPALKIANQTNRQELRNSGVTRIGMFSQLVALVDDQSSNLTPLQESLLSGFIGFSGSKKP